MEHRKPMTMEDGMRGPIVHFDQGDGITAIGCRNAIDFHVISPLVVVYDVLMDMVGGLGDREAERAMGYLANMRNAIFMLARIEEEAVNDFEQRHNANG